MVLQFRLSRSVLVVALLFAAATLLYSVLWLGAIRWALPTVELGYENQYLAVERAQLVLDVYKGSAAEQAGLRTGARIVAVNGQRIQSPGTSDKAWRQARSSDTTTSRAW